jgi:hypothetical protein
MAERVTIVEGLSGGGGERRTARHAGGLLACVPGIYTFGRAL